MRLTLATLPLHAVDLDGRLTLRHGSDDAPGTRVAVLGLGADALLAAAPHLGATLTLTLCDGAPAPALDAATHSRIYRDGVRASLAACEGVARSRAAAGLAAEGATSCAHDVGAMLATRPEADAPVSDLPRAGTWGEMLACAVEDLAAGRALGADDARLSSRTTAALRTIAARLAPVPGPSRDELAARLAEVERELADERARVASLEKLGDAAADELNRVCGQHVTTCEALCRLARGEALPVDPGFDAAVGPLAVDALRRIAERLAARVDREPPQRAAGLGAGVDLGGYVNRGHVVGMFEGAADHMEWVARNDPSPAVRDAVALLASRTRLLASTLLPATARQDVRSADRGADAVEPCERVGSAVERAVVCEGVAAAGGAR